MLVELIKQNDQATSNWSGGTTTQMAIYPKNASYSEKNFMWRLSSARVDLEESTFTSLPGIWRLIMVLEGEMRLEHTGHHTVDLKPFEQDSFSGGWTTTSFGKVRDFNLMMAAGCSGELAAIKLPAKASSKTAICNQNSDRYSRITSAFYCAKGTISITVGAADTYELNQGDLLLLNADRNTQAIPVTITGTGSSQSCVIRADITY